MQPRHVTGATSFAPDDLKLIFKAYDAAWREIVPKIDTDPAAIEAARMVLATIVLGLAANTEPMARDRLGALAVAVFHGKRRLGAQYEPASLV
jgi:hypothetical protein